MGAGKAQRLGAHLVELAIAATLRTLVAEHRAHVVEALAAFVQQVVLGYGAHHAGGIFRAQCQRLAIQAVFKGIHFLLDHIGHFAQAAHEQAGRLDDGGADIAIGKARHDLAHLALQPFPVRGMRRQDVVHALDRGNFLCHEIVVGYLKHKARQAGQERRQAGLP